MSLQHFFLDDQVIANENSRCFALQLSDDDLKHAKVLRLKPGEHIAVIDAAQDYFECEIEGFEDGAFVVSIAAHGESNSASCMGCVTLFQGISKGDKMDTVIRQVTELGASGVVPVACERSVVRLDPEKASKRAQRWRAIGRSASMQSGRRSIPDISDPVSIEGACGLLSALDAAIICWEESDGALSIGSAIKRSYSAAEIEDASRAHIGVVVGPEGGLADEEVSALLSCNEHSAVVSLGDTILRTETAGVVATALALYELGGLGNGIS